MKYGKTRVFIWNKTRENVFYIRAENDVRQQSGATSRRVRDDGQRDGNLLWQDRDAYDQ